MNELRPQPSPLRKWRMPSYAAVTAAGLLLCVLAAIFISALFTLLVVLAALLLLVRLIARRWQRSRAGGSIRQ